MEKIDELPKGSSANYQSEPSQPHQQVRHWASFANLLTAGANLAGFLITSGVILFALGQWKDYQQSQSESEEKFRRLVIEISVRKLALIPHLENLVNNKENRIYYEWTNESLASLSG
jgi:hypothetical protein